MGARSSLLTAKCDSTLQIGDINIKKASFSKTLGMVIDELIARKKINKKYIQKSI